MTLLPVMVPIKTISEANVSQREHWAVKHRRHEEQKAATALALRQAWGPMVGRWTTPATVTLTRIAGRACDDDNLQGSLKYVRDTVARWLGLDDADPLLAWRYAQQRSDRRWVSLLQRTLPTYAVEIRVEEREEKPRG